MSTSDLGVDLIFENDETWDFLNLEINSSGEVGTQDGENNKNLDSSTPSSEMAPPGEKNSSNKEGKKKMKNKEKETEGKSEQEKVHIFTERERRKKMRNMFTNLHALLPQLPPKVFTYIYS